MAGLCEGGSERAGSLKAIYKLKDKIKHFGFAVRTLFITTFGRTIVGYMNKKGRQRSYPAERLPEVGFLAPLCGAFSGLLLSFLIRYIVSYKQNSARTLRGAHAIPLLPLPCGRHKSMLGMEEYVICVRQ
ncbi:hypothetical protein ANN_19840 [Periplaneta americana]|uniref:Uncharacterized protein n=1 Tax=Periplaneta americana TaxID=6978 RepID=A0ABQ8SBD5_PERAM|nr:hypothetical protein ANN_19840 [Periplaneta americana]